MSEMRRIANRPAAVSFIFFFAFAHRTTILLTQDELIVELARLKFFDIEASPTAQNLKHAR